MLSCDSKETTFIELNYQQMKIVFNFLRLIKLIKPISKCNLQIALYLQITFPNSYPSLKRVWLKSITLKHADRANMTESSYLISPAVPQLALIWQCLGARGIFGIESIGLNRFNQYATRRLSWIKNKLLISLSLSVRKCRQSNWQSNECRNFFSGYSSLRVQSFKLSLSQMISYSFLFVWQAL